MRKCILLAALLAVLFVLSSCAETKYDAVALSLGRYDNMEYYTDGGFQDHTDYAKYTYSSPTLADNKYLVRLDKRRVERLNGYLDDFEKWVDLIREGNPKNELAENYDFDRSAIDDGDYYYIDGRYSETLSDIDYNDQSLYDIYFFDMQTNTLYYFHNNT